MCAMVALRILQRTQRVDVAPDRLPEKVHFMRFKNSSAASVAAAVSAVVFSAVFQPAEAGLLFYAEMTAPNQMTLYTRGSINTTSLSTFVTPTTPNLTYFAGVTGRAITNAATVGDGDFAASNRWTITSGSTNVSTVLESGPSFIEPSFTTGDNSLVRWNTTNTTVSLTLPQTYTSGAAFVGNQLYNVRVTSLSASLGWSDAGTWAAPVQNRSWNLPNGETVQIFSVPEPTHMVFVAGIGAALGAWRLRKLRRSREAAGDAIAG